MTFIFAVNNWGISEIKIGVNEAFILMHFETIWVKGKPIQFLNLQALLACFIKTYKDEINSFCWYIHLWLVLL